VGPFQKENKYKGHEGGKKAFKGVDALAARANQKMVFQKAGVGRETGRVKTSPPKKGGAVRGGKAKGWVD